MEYHQSKYKILQGTDREELPKDTINVTLLLQLDL